MEQQSSELLLKEGLLEKLENVKESRDVTNLKPIIRVLNSPEMRIVFDNFLELKTEDENEIELLGVVLQCCSTIYELTGESTGLTDSEYDLLLEFYREKTGKDIVGTEVGNEEAVFHKYPSLRGTLDKIYKLTEDDYIKNKSQRTLEDWVKSAQRKLEEAGVSIDLYEEEVYEFPKFDGVSCVFECDEHGNLERALTRGDVNTNEAKDITHIFAKSFKSPIENPKGKHGLKTEIMISNEDFEKIKEMEGVDYKNSRSLVSSILNRNVVDERAKKLIVVPLRYSYYDKKNGESNQMLAPGAFDYPFLRCKLKDLDGLHRFAFEHATVFPGLRCDGSVIYFINPKVQQILGRENNRQKFEVAFKFTQEIAYSKVVDVEFTTGLFGRLTPRVVFKPVTMKGNKIERASLGSYEIFKELQLRKKDKIKIYYDITPYATFDENDPKCKRSIHEVIEAPLLCPECNHALEENESGAILYCSNPDCPCRRKGKILNFVTKMNIGELNEETINDLYDAKLLLTIKDLYSLEDHTKEILKLKGYGKVKVNKILNQINSHRKVFPSTLFGAIGIEGMGAKKFKPIFQKFFVNEFLDMVEQHNSEDLIAIKGIRRKTAERIFNGMEENMELVEFLLDELDVVQEPKSEDIKFSAVFTKVRDEDIERFIIEHGGIVNGTVKRDTTFLIIPKNGVSSSKITKAKKYKVPIVEIEHVKKYITDEVLKKS